MSDRIYTEIELRESGRLHGLILTEGRASSDRRELFVPGALEWPSTGVRIRPAHMVDEGSVTAYPVRQGPEIRVSVHPTVELREAVESGKRFMSVEFRAIEESTTDSGIREISRALLIGAAVVERPSYQQTAAEIRSELGLFAEKYLLYL